MSEFDWVKNLQNNNGGRRGGGGGRGGGGRGPDTPQLNIDPGQYFPILWGFIGVALLAWGIMTSYYTVEADEQAIVLRLGKVHAQTGPGFHGKLPFGIDHVHKGAVLKVHQAEFGYRTVKAGVESQFDHSSPEVLAEATMLTGDLNLVVVTWEVRYKISNLNDYLFEVRQPVETLRGISEAIMRIEIGDRSVDEVLVLDRINIENRVADKMQTMLDDLKCGIQVVKVNLKKADPPEAVRDAFNAVNRARQFKDRIVNEAEGEANKKIPAARGAKERAIKEAQGYEIARVNRADGETVAFETVLSEYREAEDITRRRLYLEAMQKAIPKVGDLTLIDSEEQGVFKLLDLNGGKK